MMEKPGSWCRAAASFTGLAACSIAALAQQASPMPAAIRVESAARADTLRVPVASRVDFRMQADGPKDWARVNVGPCAVRTFAAQDLASVRLEDGEVRVTHQFSTPGWSLVSLSWGPAADRNRSDAWQRVTHCVKLILFVEPPVRAGAPDGRGSADPGFAAKVGQRFEIVPLVPPPALTVGSDLPVRIYSDFEKAAGIAVSAVRPDGSTEAKTTDPTGSTYFTINQNGRWLVRYQTQSEGRACLAELVFDVEAPAARDERP